MDIIDEINSLDSEIKQLNLPFNKGLPILQQRLWEIADRHNTTGPEVFKMYMDWKSKEL